MTLIDVDKFLGYLIFSKHIDSLKCIEVKEAVEMCKVDVLEQIRDEIEQIEGNEVEVSDMQGNRYKYETITKDEALQIIDKYR